MKCLKTDKEKICLLFLSPPNTAEIVFQNRF